RWRPSCSCRNCGMWSRPAQPRHRSRRTTPATHRCQRQPPWQADIRRRRMRTTPPFRADHVGSLLRPVSLLAARDEVASGLIDAAQLRSVEDATIAAAVDMQAGAGLQSATDGEFRRASWHMDFIYQLGGIGKAPGNLAVKFRNKSGTIEFTPAALHIDSKIG